MGGLTLTTDLMSSMSTLSVPPPAARVIPATPETVEPAPEVTKQAAPERQPMVAVQENLQAHFTFDQTLHQVVITLTRQDSGEVVRQIPAEQVQNFLHSFLELAGQFFDQRA